MEVTASRWIDRLLRFGVVSSLALAWTAGLTNLQASQATPQPLLAPNPSVVGLGTALPFAGGTIPQFVGMPDGSLRLQSASPAVDADTLALAPCVATPNDGSTLYGTVQAAVDAAAPGGTVKVAGTCTGVEMRAAMSQTVYISKSLTIRGGYTPTNWIVSDPLANPTTLDALDSGRVVRIVAGAAVTLENLSLTGGRASYGGGVYVYAATARIHNCLISENTAATSGGWRNLQ